jgi:hypothetical protein
MKRTLLAAAATGLTAGAIVTAAPAVAERRCLFQGDWNCYGPPQYNGPLQNTQLPLLCPGGASLHPCQQYVPQP